MSINSLGGGMTSLSSGTDSDIPESLTIGREGYDYVFVPKFGPGYECPICLSVLREPRQTKCGHRFCRDCISHSMSESSNRCPVDNEPLSENEIFPDNCIKREILSCPIKCPNHLEGCTELTTITHIQKHLEQCLLSLLPCPLNCACVIPRRDIQDHQLNHCEKRMVLCPNCQEDMPACESEKHKSKCPKEVLQCFHCGHQVFRDELDHHIQSVCKNVIVPCPFQICGCNESVLREIEGVHLSAEIPSHMKMLATSYSNLLEGLSSLAVDLRQINKQTGTSQSDEDSQNGIGGDCWISCSDRVGNSYADTCQKHPRSQSHRNSGNLSIEDHNSEILGGSVGRRLSTNSGISGSNNNEGGNKSVENHSCSSMPPPSRVSEEKKDSSNNNSNVISVPKLPLSGSHSVPILYQSSATASSNIPISSDQDTSASNILQPNLADFANSLHNLCSHQQKVIEKQQMIVSNLCLKLASAETRLKHLEGEGTVGSTQNACGDFYWSIGDFSQHRQKALKEETSILHSPAFYSSPWGYKLCVRVNINGSFNAQGEHFVSLFIHFMQGNNDHLLNWPFVGQIVLSIVDQNPSCKERRHAMETLKARPEIAAFQKPTSARNHKGFGYTDFISLNVLDNGNFIREDTLIIRAQVFPSPV